MHRDGAEITLAVAAAVGGDGKADGFHGAHFTLTGIVRVQGVLEFVAVNRVHLFRGQGWGRRVLNHVAVPKALRQALCADRVVILVKGMEHARKGIFVRQAVFHAGQFQVALRVAGIGVNKPADPARVPASFQGFGQFQDAVISQTVDQVIRLGIQEDRAAQAVGPKVVMRQSAQGGFHTPQNNGRCILEMPPDQVGINDARPVRPAVVLPAGGKVVQAAGFAQGSGIGHHRVDRAGAHAPEKQRFAQAQDIVLAFNVRLSNDAHLIAVRQ